MANKALIPQAEGEQQPPHIPKLPQVPETLRGDVVRVGIQTSTGPLLEMIWWLKLGFDGVLCSALVKRGLGLICLSHLPRAAGGNCWASWGVRVNRGCLLCQVPHLITPIRT